MFEINLLNKKYSASTAGSGFTNGDASFGFVMQGEFTLKMTDERMAIVDLYDLGIRIIGGTEFYTTLRKVNCESYRNIAMQWIMGWLQQDDNNLAKLLFHRCEEGRKDGVQEQQREMRRTLGIT